MKENKNVDYLYCKEITEDEIQEFIERKYKGYIIKDMIEENYNLFRDYLWAVNLCLNSDLETLVGYEEETLYFRMKKEIQLELMEAIRLNSIIQLSDVAVSLIDSEVEE